MTADAGREPEPGSDTEPQERASAHLPERANPEPPDEPMMDGSGPQEYSADEE